MKKTVSVFLHFADPNLAVPLVLGQAYKASIKKASYSGIVVIDDILKSAPSEPGPVIGSVVGTYDDSVLVLTTDGTTISLYSDRGPNRVDNVAAILILKAVEDSGVLRVEVSLPA